MESQLTAEKRKPIFSKIQVNFKELFGGLATAIVSGVTLQWSDMTVAVTSMIFAVGLKKSPEEAAYRLVTTAMASSIFKLITEGRDNLFSNCTIKEVQSLSDSFGLVGFALEDTFFENPKASSFMGDMQQILRLWLKDYGTKPAQIESTVNRLPSYFVYALNDEWRKNEGEYTGLRDYLVTPFFSSVRREQDWRRYRAHLEKQISEGIFGASFGLSDIYIPLNAYYFKYKGQDAKSTHFKSQNENIQNVGDLSRHLVDWLNQGDKDDAIRVISGGPGSGKSSFAKMFANYTANYYDIIYIPLHLMDLKKDLEDAIGECIRDSFAENPCQTSTRLVLIFDGLDELSQQGRACLELAEQFVIDVRRYVNVRNQSVLHIQALMTGRDLAVQGSKTVFRKEGQILYMSPYTPDQRDRWWKKYGEVSAHAYEAFPKELSRNRLEDLTTQPLLNFMIALSYERGKIDFTHATNLNEIYQDLVSAVFERNYAPGGRLSSVRTINEIQFFELMEEIAVSVWHNSGRVTTIREIEAHCIQSKVEIPLEQFQKDAENSVVNLLTAFYFKQSDSRQGGEKTFEFTHKSFGEYLLARRIIQQLDWTYDNIQDKRNNPRKGWSQQDALKHWIMLCGKTAIDKYNFEYIQDEVLLHGIDKARVWQHMICVLIAHMLKHGMPFEELTPRISFYEEMQQSRNAEEALLATLSACASVTKEISHIEWGGNDTIAGEWIGKLSGQRNRADVFALSLLNYMDFSGCCFDIADLFNANLAGSSLIRSSFYNANLRRANLTGAVLSDADMIGAILSGTNFSGANLSGAILHGAILYDTEFYNADLSMADLRGANLKEVDLTGRAYNGMNARGRHIHSADFRGANLSGTKVFKRDFAYVDFSHALNVDQMIIYDDNAKELKLVKDKLVLKGDSGL